MFLSLLVRGKVSCRKFPSRSLFVFFKYSQCDQVIEDDMGAVCSRHPWMRNTHGLASMSITNRTDNRSACHESPHLLWIHLLISGSQESATGLSVFWASRIQCAYLHPAHFRCMLILLFYLCQDFPNTSFLSGLTFVRSSHLPLYALRSVSISSFIILSLW
jgi:hypothetical protein